MEESKMTRTDLQQHLWRHGCIRGIIEGAHKQLWGMITEVEKNCINFVDHYDHFYIFFIKDVKSFTPEEINTKYKYPKIKCDCGHKSDERFMCENCGKTFCGDCGHQSRKGGGNKNLCSSCLKTLKVLNDEKLSETEVDTLKQLPLNT